MALFKPRLFTSLSEAVAKAATCRRLALGSVDAQIQHCGAQFAQLTHLQELALTGHHLFPSREFDLPVEIGQLTKLEHLSILNLPIDFPEWIRKLPNLRQLTLRGTDLAQIPDWISELRTCAHYA